MHAALQRTHLRKKNKDAAESFMMTRLISTDDEGMEKCWLDVQIGSAEKLWAVKHALLHFMLTSPTTFGEQPVQLQLSRTEMIVACAALAFTKGHANATLNPCPCQDVIRFGFPPLLSLRGVIGISSKCPVKRIPDDFTDVQLYLELKVSYHTSSELCRSLLLHMRLSTCVPTRVT